MTVPLVWLPREPPLEPAAVAATGPVVSVLRAAAALRVADGAELRVCESPDWLVVLGDPVDLPWADGATYLGWDSGLLISTVRRPSIPVDLLRNALPSAALQVVMPNLLLASDLPIRAATASQLTTQGHPELDRVG